MKLQRFFVEASVKTGQPLTIPSLDLVNQMKNVFRMSQGDQVILFDNTGFDFTATIDKFEPVSVSFKVIEGKPNTVKPGRETYLFASIVKKDNFEWIVEKATELGVSHIVPIVSDRSEKKDLNSDRLKKIIIEAAEQSGRGTLPVLHEISDLAKVLDTHAHVKSIAWDPSATKFTAKDVAEVNGSYIGPEGGWSSAEIELFAKHSIPTCSLGPQVLRAETAVVAVISRLVF